MTYTIQPFGTFRGNAMRAMKLALSAMMLALAGLAHAQPVVDGTLTYQGQLRVSGAPASGNYDFEFRLFTTVAGAIQVGQTVLVDDLALTNGQVRTELNFGTPSPFATSDQRFLQIAVRDGASTGAYTVLSPRTNLRETPYATKAVSADLALVAGANAVNSLSVIDGSLSAADVNTTQIQMRVTGTCGAGSSVSSVNSDGTVNCVSTGAGTITGVTAGTGISGGGTSGNVTVNIATGGVTSTQISDGSVGSADINTAQVQQRVTGSCGFPQFIASVNADGTVSCRDELIVNDADTPGGYPNAGTTTVSVPSTGVGDTAMVMGLDGLPIIAYYDDVNSDLVTLKCLNVACSQVFRIVHDSAGSVGQRPKIALIGTGPAALPVITYYDQTNLALKVARCNDASCSTSTVSTIADTTNAGANHAIADLGTVLGVAFYDTVGGNLRATRCTFGPTTCGPAWDIDASADNVGQDIAIGLGAQIILAYRNATSGNLLMKRCGTFSSTSCNTSTTAQTAVSDGTVAEVLGAAALNDSRPMVLFRTTGPLTRVITCPTVTCAGFNAPVTVFNLISETGALSVGSDGLPFIFGISSNGPQRYIVKCGQTDCSGSAAYQVGIFASDMAGTVGLGRTARDYPYLVFTQNNTVQIQVCENRNCDNNGRR
jgi:hypothetical protein